MTSLGITFLLAGAPSHFWTPHSMDKNFTPKYNIHIDHKEREFLLPSTATLTAFQTPKTASIFKLRVFSRESQSTNELHCNVGLRRWKILRRQLRTLAMIFPFMKNESGTYFVTKLFSLFEKDCEIHLVHHSINIGLGHFNKLIQNASEASYAEVNRADWIEKQHAHKLRGKSKKEIYFLAPQVL